MGGLRRTPPYSGKAGGLPMPAKAPRRDGARGSGDVVQGAETNAVWTNAAVSGVKST
jgi:hypothetical protein